MSGMSQLASLHQTFVGILTFAGQTFQLLRMRGEDGAFRQMCKCVAVVGKDIKCIGVYYNRGLAVFQLLQ